MKVNHVYWLLYFYYSCTGADTEDSVYSILEGSDEDKTTVASTKAPISFVNANLRASLSKSGSAHDDFVSESSSEHAQSISSSHVREQGCFYE